MEAVTDEQVIKALFGATPERKSRALLILEGEDIPQNIDEPLLLTMGEAAKMLGISRTSIWRLTRLGRLQKRELYPNSYRIRKQDVLDLVNGKGGSNV